MISLIPRTAPLASMGPATQRTLKTEISCVGTGLHSGLRIRLTLLPAPIDTGIVFRRTDLGLDIPARHDRVVDTRLCTVLGLPDRPEARVGTVEHVMAALVAAGIDNAVVAVDGPEVPVLDGSAEPFLFLIDSAGTVPQAAPLRWIEVRRPVRVAQGEAFAELRPGIPADDHPVLQASLSISFAAEAIGRQALTLALDDLTVRHELARARTFTQAAEVEQLRAAGLALGGSLDNAVVVDGALVLNPTGLRMRDEFVRHKMLDMVGDLALAGTRLHGTVVASRTGHRLNNQLLQALFADPENWGWAEAAPAWAAIRAA